MAFHPSAEAGSGAEKYHVVTGEKRGRWCPPGEVAGVEKKPDDGLRPAVDLLPGAEEVAARHSGSAVASHAVRRYHHISNVEYVLFSSGLNIMSYTFAGYRYTSRKSSVLTILLVSPKHRCRQPCESGQVEVDPGW